MVIDVVFLVIGVVDGFVCFWLFVDVLFFFWMDGWLGCFFYVFSVFFVIVGVFVIL